jgi:hypothetical protein
MMRCCDCGSGEDSWWDMTRGCRGNTVEQPRGPDSRRGICVASRTADIVWLVVGGIFFVGAMFVASLMN